MSDLWLVYSTEQEAVMAIEEIDGNHDYPHTSTYAHDGSPAPDAQQTVTWAEPRKLATGEWGFPKPPDEHMPSDPGEILEYDPDWFPPPQLP